MILLGAAGSIIYYLVTRGEEEQAYQPDTPVRIEILNGCGKAGLAARAKAYLRRQGYDVLSVGNASDHFTQTVIVERRSPTNANARSVARTLGLQQSTVTQVLDSLSPVWVTLILGEDYQAYLPDTVETIQ